MVRWAGGQSVGLFLDGSGNWILLLLIFWTLLIVVLHE